LPPTHSPLRLDAAILSRIRSEVTSRSNWANDRSTLRVSRPIEVVVLNCWDDAAFSGARLRLYPSRHPTQQDRRPVEAAALPVLRGSVARGTIERRPEKFGRDEAVLRRQGRIRDPGRREHFQSVPGLTPKRPSKNARPSPCAIAGPHTKHVGSGCSCGLIGVSSSAALRRSLPSPGA
jgi:hypothetical protein